MRPGNLQDRGHGKGAPAYRRERQWNRHPVPAGKRGRNPSSRRTPRLDRSPSAPKALRDRSRGRERTERAKPDDARRTVPSWHLGATRRARRFPEATGRRRSTEAGRRCGGSGTGSRNHRSTTMHTRTRRRRGTGSVQGGARSWPHRQIEEQPGGEGDENRRSRHEEHEPTAERRSEEEQVLEIEHAAQHHE